MAVSLSGKKVHARVYAVLMGGSEDAPHETVVWAPSHQVEDSVDVWTCDNGQLFTMPEFRGNEAADGLAKRGVLEHRVESSHGGEVHGQVLRELPCSRTVWMRTQFSALWATQRRRVSTQPPSA